MDAALIIAAAVLGFAGLALDVADHIRTRTRRRRAACIAHLDAVLTNRGL